MSASDRLRDGQTFGRYQIVRLIGEGGMGAVYEAIHPGLKKRFAIKTLLPAAAQNEEARLRFLREGEAAASINHPNVVAVSDVGTEDGISFLVMELLEGQTLGDLLAQRSSLSAEESIALLLPVISAVATGHDRGVIHRDLKPQNIFLAKGPWGDSIPKVLDFGVSKLTGDDNAVITRTLSVLGTAAYMSPEQARGAKRVDFQSDQYALGLILYEMLTGSRAHPGENSLEILHNVASGVLRPAGEIKPDLRADLDAVLTRMLAASPADRYPSLHDCGRALLGFADDKTRMALTSAFSPPPQAAQARDTGDGARAEVPRSGSTERSAPVSGSGAGGTLQLPVGGSDSPSDTTLRQAAIETAKVDPMGRRSSGSKIRVVLAAVVGVMLVAGAIVWTATKSATQGTSPAPGEQAPPTASAADRSAVVQPAAPTTIAADSPSTTPFEIRVVPPEAEIALDDRPPVRGRLEIVLPLAGASHELRVSAAGYLSRVVSFGPDDRPPSEIRLEREPTTASPRASAKVAARSNKAGPTKPRPVMPAKATETPKPGEVAATAKRGSNNALIIK